MSLPQTSTKACPIYIHRVHIADGFADDCEELIHRWLKTETLTYETFCEIWKDMQFNFVYHGRTTGAEMAELSEELIHIAKHYMVSNTDNFEETIGGLFLVYALLRLQPFAGFAPLRLVPEDAAALTRIETRARSDRRYDVLYILASVLIEGPVQYHAAARERGMESALRKYLEGTTGIDRLGVRPKGVFFRQNEESDLLRELNSITKRYTEAKKAIGGQNLGLNYTNETLATDLDTSLKGLINGIVDDGPEATQKIQDHYSRVQEIKAKAMKQAVQGVKHLATVSKAAQSCSSPKPRTEGGTPIRGKRRLKKAGRRSNKTSPSKRPALSRARKSSTSDTSADDDLSLSSDDDVSDTCQPGGSQDEDNDTDKDTQSENDVEEREVDIEIESLPVFIRTEQDGNLYEIEVIDRLDPKEADKKIVSNEAEDTETKLKKLKDVSIEKIEDAEGNSSSQDSDGMEMAKLSRIPREVMKKEKRDLKKTRIKSHFKRMGMLKMANFDDVRRKSPRKKKAP